MPAGDGMNGLSIVVSVAATPNGLFPLRLDALTGSNELNGCGREPLNRVIAFFNGEVEIFFSLFRRSIAFFMKSCRMRLALPNR